MKYNANTQSKSEQMYNNSKHWNAPIFLRAFFACITDLGDN